MCHAKGSPADFRGASVPKMTAQYIIQDNSTTFPQDRGIQTNHDQNTFLLNDPHEIPLQYITTPGQRCSVKTVIGVGVMAGDQLILSEQVGPCVGACGMKGPGNPHMHSTRGLGVPCWPLSQQGGGSRGKMMAQTAS